MIPSETLSRLSEHSALLGQQWLAQMGNGVDALSSPFLVKGTASHREGWALLSRDYITFAIAVVQASLIGIIAANLIITFWDDKQQTFLFFSPFPVYEDAYPAKANLFYLLLSAIPYFMVSNVLSFLTVTRIVRTRLTGFWWKAPAASLLGVVPLRFVAGWFLPNWIMLRGDWRAALSVNARLLQISVLYALAMGRSYKYVEHDWALSMKDDGPALLDSFGTYSLLWGLLAFPIFLAYGFLISFLTFVPHSLRGGVVPLACTAATIAFARSCLCAFTVASLRKYCPFTDAYANDGTYDEKELPLPNTNEYPINKNYENGGLLIGLAIFVFVLVVLLRG